MIRNGGAIGNKGQTTDHSSLTPASDDLLPGDLVTPTSSPATKNNKVWAGVAGYGQALEWGTSSCDFTLSDSHIPQHKALSAYYLAARQLEFFKGRSTSGPNTDALADALAIAQHHDAVSGTQRHVAADYALRLSIGYNEAEKLVASSLAFLAESRSSNGQGNSVTSFQQCPLLDISFCAPSEAALSNGKNLVVIIYNSLGWKREETIRIPVKGRSSTISTVHTYEASDNNTIEVGQGSLKLLYSADEGKLMRYVNTKTLITAFTEQSYGYYSGNDGTDKDPRASGAYVFRPNVTFSIKSENQVTMVYKEKEHAEVEFNVRDFRKDWELQVNQPIAGNYYPLYNSTELSVLVDRSVGGSSLADGQIELMLHRRLIHDDIRGVGEVLNETVCVPEGCDGLTEKGWRRTVGQEIYSALLLAFSEQDGNDWASSHIPTFSAIDPSYWLSDNIAIITLQELENGKDLLRLARLYEDKEFSVMASVELKKLFPNKKIKKVTEMSLSENQERGEMEKRRLAWKVEGGPAGEESKVLDRVTKTLAFVCVLCTMLRIEHCQLEGLPGGVLLVLTWYQMSSDPSAIEAISEGSSAAAANNRMVETPFMNKYVNVRLDDNNFLLWKQQVLLMIQGHELEHLLDESLTVPPQTIVDESGELIVNPVYRRHKKQDSSLASWLLSTISSSILPQLVGAHTSAKIWNTVLSMFSKLSTTKIMSLHGRLMSLKKGDLYVREFSTQIKEICDLLATSGSPVSEIDQIVTLLNGLPGDFEPFVAAITVSREPYTFDTVTSVLIDAESRIGDLMKTVLHEMRWSLKMPPLTLCKSTLLLLKEFCLLLTNGIRLWCYTPCDLRQSWSILGSTILKKRNLLSVSKRTQDNNVYLEFHSDKCFVNDEETGRIQLEDMFSRNVWVYLMCNKSDITQAFNLFHALVKNQFKTNIVALQTDGGGEYRGLEQCLVATGIKHRVQCPHTSQQNGVVERKHRRIIDTALTLLAQSVVPFKYWSYAVLTAVYLINGLPAYLLGGISPFEKLYGPSRAYFFATLHNIMDINALTNQANTMEDEPDVVSRVAAQLEDTHSEPTHSSATPNDDQNGSISVQELGASSRTVSDAAQHVTNKHHMVTLSKAGIFKPKVYNALFNETPLSVQDALQHKHWRTAVEIEFKALTDNNTWNLVPLPADRKAIGYKWLFRIKHNSDGSVNRFKARLVAKGYSQEEVYMVQPEGFEKTGEHGEKLVCKLQKALYGLRQAPRNWYQKLQQCLCDMGFRPSRADSSLFIRGTKHDITYVAVYVDDILVMGSSEKCVKEVKKQLHGSQKKYVQELLTKFNVHAKPVDTPLPITPKLSSENAGAPVNAQQYRSAVGALLYNGLWIMVNQGTGKLQIKAFTDADWGSDLDDRRSVSGYYVYLVLDDMNVELSQAPVIWCDNTSTVAMAANPVLHAKVKHVDLDVHFVREKVMDKQLVVNYVPTNCQIADVLTKP
ncbi:Detected protein of unknown function [Hibiscus syriacus]|uniref:Integrase catalytic domain-containing protein n=1 Tax=Hibiscus syriacus TaxID=106335 RepID=A0A6A2XYT4_HIBSY|nr:Detected protein of unknown function [Hibiscus syriacus]